MSVAKNSNHQGGDGSDKVVAESPAPKAGDPFAEAEEALREYEFLTEIEELQDARAESRRPYLASLPAEEPLNRLIRYGTMLDRQLHRALAELRRRRSLNKSQASEDPGGLPAADLSAAPRRGPLPSGGGLAAAPGSVDKNHD